MTTMEEIIETEALAIRAVLKEDSMGLENMIDAIEYRVDNILRTLNGGDPSDDSDHLAACGCFGGS